MAYNCPHCGKTDQQIFNRRELRMSLGSRTNRRARTKSGDRERPRSKLERKIRDRRRTHEGQCSQR